VLNLGVWNGKTKNGSETIKSIDKGENKGKEAGGADRDRTGDLLTALDYESLSLASLFLASSTSSRPGSASF
jgi:hypothetical protein